MNEIKILIGFSIVLMFLSLGGAFYLWNTSNDFSQKQIESNQRNVSTKNKIIKSNDIESLREIALINFKYINETIERNIEMTKDFYQALLG